MRDRLYFTGKYDKIQSSDSLPTSVDEKKGGCLCLCFPSYGSFSVIPSSAGCWRRRFPPSAFTAMWTAACCSARCAPATASLPFCLPWVCPSCGATTSSSSWAALSAPRWWNGSPVTCWRRPPTPAGGTTPTGAATWTATSVSAPSSCGACWAWRPYSGSTRCSWPSTAGCPRWWEKSCCGCCWPCWRRTSRAPC